MKKLIKKILKEEFEWIDDIQTNPAEEFLYEKFMECKLEPIGHSFWLGWTRYVDKNGKILFLDNINSGSKNKFLWFNHDEITKRLEEMGLSRKEMEKLLKDMLYETHKRTVVLLDDTERFFSEYLYETHKIKNLKEEFDWADEIEIDPAKEFLYDKFMECKLEPVKNRNYIGYTRYVDKNGKILFIDNIETGEETTFLYFDYEEIYRKLEEMGLNYEEMKKLCIDMLYETHKRKVLTAFHNNTKPVVWLYETHKRKVLTAYKKTI